MRETEVTRKTNETDITLRLGLPDLTRDGVVGIIDETARVMEIYTGVPFFDHMLHAMFFHGGFSVDLRAVGDVEIDDHHTVEDVGIVIGTALREAVELHGPVRRFGHSVVPMDDALGEVVVDAGGRSYLVYQATYPQDRAGRFDLSLVREFFQGLSSQGRINMHVLGRYGDNGHHLAEALFKAAGRALGSAFLPRETVASTKGVL
ncbi:MAG: imidazoleglycerol-phosphate dehydratase [Alkalispirochaeta sp.]